MQGCHLRKYGVETTVDFEVFEIDGVDLRVDWVPAAADCEIMKDEGTSTQCTNTATDEGSTYSIVLTATEMQAARLVLKVVDAATKVFLDKVLVIETYGNASAMHAFDLDTASQVVASVTGAVGSLTGHTVQTGDSFARIGATGSGLTSLAQASAWTATRAAYLDTLTSLAGETRDANVLDQFKRTIAMVESQRPSHTHQPIGNILFVDPVNGATHASGARGGITDPYLTIQDCHDNAVTDSNHDVIMLLAGAGAGATTHTVAATTTISKRYTFIRGPGRDFTITRTGNGDTLAITADGVEISGVQIATAATGAGHGIQVTDADFLMVQDCWINATQGDGINILRGSNCQILNNTFTDAGQGGAGQGIDILGTAGSSNNNNICHNIFRDTAGDAIQVSGGTTNNTVICDNTIEGSTAFGIDITASSTDAIVLGNKLGNNTSGDINDLGTTSVLLNNEQYAKHSIATELRLAELDPANIPADVDLILADTGELQTDWVDGGRLDLIQDIIAADTTTDIPATLATLVTAVITNATGADVATDVVALKVVADAIKAITDVLPDSGALTTIGTDTARLTAVRAAVLTDWINGGRLDLLLDAIPTTTPPTAAANADAVWDEARSGHKTSGTFGESFYTIVSGAAATGTLSTTTMTTDLTESTDDHYIGRAVIFLDGVLHLQGATITDYSGTSGQVTFAALTEAPLNNQRFIIV